jgi:hypothetical protein
LNRPPRRAKVGPQFLGGFAMMKRVVTIIGLCLACAMPAVAGIHYKSRSFQEGKGASKQMDMTVESWVDGDNAKILFTESKNDLMGKDSYLVTTDGGKIIYLVDPKEKTYTEWDLDAMMNMFGAVMESMGGMLQMEFLHHGHEDHGNEAVTEL